MLRVHTIFIDLTEISADRAQTLCNEALWKRFAATALTFPYLQKVELERLVSTAPGSAGSGAGRDPTPLGISDTAFRQLLESGKFVCRVVDPSISFYPLVTVLSATNTVDPEGRKSGADKKGGDLGDEGSVLHAELETAADHPVEDDGE